MVRVTIKSLEAQLKALEEDLLTALQGREAVEQQLVDANMVITEQTTALATATAQAQAAAANQANQQAAQPEAETNNTTVPRPVVPRGRRIKIQKEMGLDDADYKAIQRSLHKLCHSSGLDWTKDFRRQTPQSLTLLYRAARTKHPVLKTYENDWATAEIVKMYFQNARSHARHHGYLPPVNPQAEAGAA